MSSRPAELARGLRLQRLRAAGRCAQGRRASPTSDRCSRRPRRFQLPLVHGRQHADGGTGACGPAEVAGRAQHAQRRRYLGRARAEVRVRRRPRPGRSRLSGQARWPRQRGQGSRRPPARQDRVNPDGDTKSAVSAQARDRVARGRDLGDGGPVAGRPGGWRQPVPAGGPATGPVRGCTPAAQRAARAARRSPEDSADPDGYPGPLHRAG